MNVNEQNVQGDMEYSVLDLKQEQKNKMPMQKAKEILKVIEWVTSAHV